VTIRLCKHPMLGGSATFLDRGAHQLKGIDGDWHLFAVDTAA